MTWATEQETREIDYRVRDEWDNGEFMTGATVDLLIGGRVIHTETFTASSEDAPSESFSAYGNGRDNHATTLALSYANAWVEAEERRAEADRLGVHPLEIVFAPFGPEWQREQDERWSA